MARRQSRATRPRRSPLRSLHPRSSTGGPPHACLPRGGQAAHSRSRDRAARARAPKSPAGTRVHASTRERRSNTSGVRRNYDHARINRPRPPTLAVTLMSRQVTRAPHQAARSPPVARSPSSARALPRAQARNALSLPHSLLLCPETVSVCVITRDRRTRDMHACGYGGETPRTVCVENGREIGAVDLWEDTRASDRGTKRERHRASADFQPHYPCSAIMPSSTSVSHCSRHSVASLERKREIIVI